MEDIIIKRSGSTPPGERPRRSIREITRDTPSGSAPLQPLKAVNQNEMPQGEQKRSTERSFPFSDDTSVNELSGGRGADHDDVRPEPLLSGSRRSMGMWGLAFLSSLVLVFAASTYFYRVNVVVVPTENIVSVSGDFSAYKDTRPGGIKMSTVTLSDETEMVVNASGTQDVARKASGTIVVYNSYSKSSQRLIKNTRFETPDGNVYRIADSVVVPGMTTVNGKDVPGSIEVVVYADAAGDTYNIGLSDFTIPGFAGDPRYAKIIARSKTDIAGGLVGRMKVVSDADKAAAEASLKADLEKSLLAAAMAQVPQGYFLAPGAATTTYVEKDTTNDGLKDTQALVALKGTLTGVLISSADLAPALAKTALVGTGYDPAAHSTLISVDRPETLAITPKNGSIPAGDTLNEFDFTVSGTARFLWKVDAEALPARLAGMSLTDFTAFISGNYPSIGRAEAHRRPFWAFWMGTFPADPVHISVTVTPPAESGS